MANVNASLKVIFFFFSEIKLFKSNFCDATATDVADAFFFSSYYSALFLTATQGTEKQKKKNVEQEKNMTIPKKMNKSDYFFNSLSFSTDIYLMACVIENRTFACHKTVKKK